MPIHNKKAGVVTLISDKVDFKTKSIIRDQERYFVIIKVSIRKKIIIIYTCIFMYIYIINIHESNNKASKYIKEIFIEIIGKYALS